MQLELQGRSVVVTGASSGIGLACCRTLAAEGADLLLVARNREALERAKVEVQAESRAEVMSLDVTQPTAGSELLEFATRTFGRVDALINGAGTSRARDLDALSDEEWQEQWELNVMAPKRLMEAIASAMAAEGRGSIVNICSSAGRRPSTTNAAYSVAKRAEIALTVVFAERFGPLGVHVNAVAPGPTATPLWVEAGGLSHQLADHRETSPEQVLEDVASGLPIGRLATPEEVAAVVTMLIARSSTNGVLWPVDGGHVPDVAS